MSAVTTYRQALTLIGFCLFSTPHRNTAFTAQNVQNYRSLRLPVKLAMAKRSSEEIMSQSWLPDHRDDDDIFAVDDQRRELENNSIQHLASLIQRKLDGDDREQVIEHEEAETTKATNLAHDRFRDLTCTYEGELVLERIFSSESNQDLQVLDTDTIRGAIIALQSLAILGMQVGVKGTPDQKERISAHLKSKNDETSSGDVQDFFNDITSKRLKHKVNITAGIQLLATLKLKRNAQSALDLLVRLGAWKKHEDLALLRSGFPTRFTEKEHQYASDAIDDSHDPDRILGLRKDLRHLKVYTIDGEYTEEVDDGLSIEKIKKSDGTERKRIWIHIADADRWGKLKFA